MLPTPNLVAQTSIGPFSVTAQTDAFQPVPSPLVFVGQDGWSVALAGDSEGHTDPFYVDLAEDVTVRMEEGVLTTLNGKYNAMTVGQQFTLNPIDDYGSIDSLRLYYFQPVARQLTFYGPNSGATTDEESGWHAVTGPNASFNFNAFAAELPVTEVISNYFAYKIGQHVTVFENGIFLRVDQAIDLGDAGMTIFIDLAGYNYGGAPTVTTMSTDQPGLVGSHFASVQGIDDTFVQLHVGGVLSPGDNLILLSGSGGGSISPSPQLPLPIYPDGNPGCTPPPPGEEGQMSCETPGTCTPDAGPYCSPGAGSPTCVDKNIKIGNPVCSPPVGGKNESTESTGYRGGFSLRAMLGFESVGELEVTLSGEVTGETSMTVKPDPGFCNQGYQCYKECKQKNECYSPAPYPLQPTKYTADFYCGIMGLQISTVCPF